MRHSLNWILISVPIMIPRSSIGMDVTAATESSDAATYAEDLLDECSPISLESADFLIDLVGGGTVESEFRSVASFSNGNEGGPLPTINQLNPQDPVSFSGGIGLDCGICL